MQPGPLLNVIIVIGKLDIHPVSRQTESLPLVSHSHTGVKGLLKRFELYIGPVLSL